MYIKFMVTAIEKKNLHMIVNILQKFPDWQPLYYLELSTNISKFNCDLKEYRETNEKKITKT